MKVCPKCKKKYPNPEDEFCSDDGGRLVLELELEVDSLVGRVVGGGFEVLGVIGSGGMGTVYRAIQSSVDRVVALKVLREELADDRVAVGRFRREAKAASLLSSPHTVTLYEAGEDREGTLFLAMELLEGTSLSGKLRSFGKLGWREALVIARQICHSLTEAHGKGIVHRDLKPENIFLTIDEGTGATPDTPRVKVLDFGIATLARPERTIEVGLTQTGVIVGTPGYMSPEQAKGLKADARSDIYALGILIYEMITGKPPFESTEAVLLMGQHISADPPPFDSRIDDEGIPEEVEYVTMKMLAKDPNARFQTSVETNQALADILDGTFTISKEELEQLRARRSKPADEKPQSRLPFYAAALFVVLLTVAVGGAVGWRGSWALGDGDENGSQASTTQLDPAGLVSKSSPGNPSETNTPEAVDITIEVQPVECRILLDGEPVEGGNRWSATQPPTDKVRVVTFEAEGYQTKVMKLRFNRDQNVSFGLLPVPDATKANQKRSKRASQRRTLRKRRTPEAGQTSDQQPSTKSEAANPAPPQKGPAKTKARTGLTLDTQFPGSGMSR